jgi:glycosyltransferase involved in cell wall biosynthesis
MKVTVVIPTRNRRDWLRLTLRSVLRQDHHELETIVVDDGSTDNTADMLTQVRDSRVRVIRHDTPQGVAASRNHGAAESGGAWIGFLDDDDLWAPEKLARQLEAASASGRSWVYAGSVNIDYEANIVGGMPPVPPEDVMALIPRYNVIPGGGSNVIVRRDEFNRVGPFDLRLKNTEDWEMWIRLSEGGPPAWVPLPLLAYRVHTMNASLDVAAIFEGVSLIERTHGTTADRGILHRWLGEQSLRTGRRGQAVKHMTIAAIQGQAANVASDVSTILRRRLSRVRASAAPNPHHPEWIEEARAWIDRLHEREKGPDPERKPAD